MDATDRRAAARAGNRTRVGVVADQYLVAETICAALGSRGYPTELLEWVPAGSAPRVPRPRSSAETRATEQLLLVVCDLDVSGRLSEARELGRRQGLPWVVVDTSGPGPAWGALLEAGARTVVVSSISLDGLVEVVDTVAAGGSTLTELERRTLIRQWQSVQETPEGLLRQMLVVDKADREILAMLYEGTTVRAIADHFGVSEATVRSQVKAALRRLSTVPRIGVPIDDEPP